MAKHLPQTEETNPTPMTKFWMVIAGDAGGGTSYRHRSKEEALDQSIKLAKTLNKNTYVLEAIAAVKVKPTDIDCEFVDLSRRLK